MSNLINNFPSKLTSIVRSAGKQGHVYTAHFEDGTQGVIRTSWRVYVSVTQIGTLGERTDFLFSGKAQPALKSWEKERFITTVQVQAVKSYEVPEHLRCRVEDL